MSLINDHNKEIDISDKFAEVAKECNIKYIKIKNPHVTFRDKKTDKTRMVFCSTTMLGTETDGVLDLKLIKERLSDKIIAFHSMKTWLLSGENPKNRVIALRYAVLPVKNIKDIELV